MGEAVIEDVRAVDAFAMVDHVRAVHGGDFDAATLQCAGCRSIWETTKANLRSNPSMETTNNDWHRGDWMQTFTGRRFYPLDPRPEDIDPIDIAHALSMLCRYAGHVKKFYSVAEHCVHMSRAVPQEFALEALLHDATEAYVVDVPRPLKIHLPDFQAVEARVAVVIAQRFGHQKLVPSGEGLAIVESPEVKDADMRIVLDERDALLSPTSYRWVMENAAPLGAPIEGWLPARAEAEYLHRLEELGVPI